MDPQYHEDLSKQMSKILRHKAEEKYRIMGIDGWVALSDLMRVGRFALGSEDDLIQVAKTSEKRGRPRFEIRDQGGRNVFIRATRKHTGCQLRRMYGGTPNEEAGRAGMASRAPSTCGQDVGDGGNNRPTSMWSSVEPIRRSHKQDFPRADQPSSASTARSPVPLHHQEHSCTSSVAAQADSEIGPRVISQQPHLREAVLSPRREPLPENYQAIEAEMRKDVPGFKFTDLPASAGSSKPPRPPGAPPPKKTAMEGQASSFSSGQQPPPLPTKDSSPLLGETFRRAEQEGQASSSSAGQQPPPVLTEGGPPPLPGEESPRRDTLLENEEELSSSSALTSATPIEPSPLGQRLGAGRGVDRTLPEWIKNQQESKRNPTISVTVDSTQGETEYEMIKRTLDEIDPPSNPSTLVGAEEQHEEAIAVVTFRPGPLGFRAGRCERTGVDVICAVDEGGQADCQGVEVRWRIRAVGDHPCTSFADQLFQDARNSNAPFQVVFVKATPEDVSSSPAEVAAIASCGGSESRSLSASEDVAHALDEDPNEMLEKYHNKLQAIGRDEMVDAYQRKLEATSREEDPKMGYAECAFDADEFGEDYISFEKDERIMFIPDPENGDGWTFGEVVGTQRRGWFPEDYVIWDR
mmetsp:Transcript_39393/g.63044  ORF Transcript_39393/g.63044 Transcript_39393/m.63044 type:complete len:636 (+) Transcript_39393:59-1966(+)